MSEITVPQAMAELEWVWVLTTSLSKNRDSIFIIDMDERESGRRRRIVPVFEDREAASKLKPKLCGDEAGREYGEQTMRLADVGTFAAKHDLEIMILDESGTILAHMEARVEQVPVH
ncbi:hypothetical protein C4J81_05735 [Deltaproteobacteria bacterium Smac51]|nr:hypothetical protein C4J81_05735 [Deltaproteobacteria bacterium Smac51]